MADPTPPPGGFQQGGWYGGRQYWNGQFGAPGVIINPNQQGAGSPVSAEVNAQSAKSQGKTPQQFNAYLSSQSTIPVSSGSGSAQSILDAYQSGASGALSGIATDASKSDAQILAEVKSQLEPTTAQPTPPNLAQTYQTFLNSPGIGGSSVNQLNAQLTDINSQIATVQATLEGQKAGAETTPGLTLDVVAGRETEAQRQAQVKLDSLNLQKGVLVDQISTQMNNISTMMQLTQQDYTNASAAWQSEFDVNSKIYDAFTAAVQNRNDLAFKQQQLAATNLQTFANLLSSGNISYGQLSNDQQLQIASMETQAGLPVGTLSKIQMSPKDRLLNVSQYRGQVTAIVANADGSIGTQTFGSVQGAIGRGGGGNVTQQKEEAIGSMEEQLSSIANSYGNISPQEWQTALQAWLDAGFTKQEFIANFGQYADPNRGDFYQAYGFNNPRKQ